MRSNSLSVLRSNAKNLMWCAPALAALFAPLASRAADIKQTLGSVEIQGVGKLFLIGSIPEGASASDLTKVQINFGWLPLVVFPTQDLENCREGSPALTSPRGEPLADLMDHPKVKAALAGSPEVRDQVEVHLNCGAKDEHGQPTLQLSLDRDGESIVLQARINSALDEWEFVDANGTVLSNATQLLFDPKSGQVSVSGTAAENDSTLRKDPIPDALQTAPGTPKSTDPAALAY